ncbi:MAG: hypothetical protein Q8898_09220 [Bacillota bacterium]|nr:hypothetical protein [Bacillota bacterium]
MSFKDLFQSLYKNEPNTKIKAKVEQLEKELSILKESFNKLEEKSVGGGGHPKEAPIIIEKINIEKIILDKYELNNHFGQLGIKELKGRLNIGATYGSEFSPKVEDEEENKIKREKKTNIPEKVPKVNIHSKSEE